MTQLVSRDEPRPPVETSRAVPTADLKPYAQVRRRRRSWRGPAIFILGPVALALVYVFAVASPMYDSQARFAVRAAEAAPDTGGKVSGGPLASIGAMSAFAADGFALRDFLQSPDALGALNKDGDYVRRMSVGSIDPLNSISGDPRNDELLKFFQRNTDIRFSLTEQILTLDVFAYTPRDAQDVAGEMILIAESFTNRMNERARADALSLASQEVEKAERRVSKASGALVEWRSRNSDIDPSKSIEVSQSVMGDLRKTLATTQAEYASVASRLSPNSQRRREMEERIRALTQQVAAEQARLTGRQGSTAQTLGEYQRLTVEQDFATRQLTSAQDSLERARIEAIRQSKYIAIIVKPTLPVAPASPNKSMILAGVFLAAALIYAIVSLIGRMALDAMR